jgi:hypothetical protein
MLCPLAIIVLYFREVLLKTFEVMEELQSNDQEQRAGLETETEDRG